MDIQIFQYQSKQTRTIQRDGETWWVLKDVCDILALSDTNKVAERLDDDELTRIKFVSGGQTREMYAVNESGLYSVILRSDKSEAKNFKRWVTHEVLPSIRKHGGYIAGQESLTDEELLSRAVLMAQSKLNERDDLIAIQNSTINRLEPKAKAFDAFTLGENDMDFNTFSKILQQTGVDTGHVRFMAQLRKDGYLMRNYQGDNVPTQRAKDRGIFSMKLTTFTHSDGRSTTKTTTRITPKGQKYLMERYSKVTE